MYTFKIPIIVHEAICISVWREKVLPELLCIASNPTQSFTLYFIVGLFYLISFNILYKFTVPRFFNYFNVFINMLIDTKPF